MFQRYRYRSWTGLLNRGLLLFLTISTSSFVNRLCAQESEFPAISQNLHQALLDSAAAFSSNLPILLIDTRGQEIIDSLHITAGMGIIDNGVNQRNFLSDPFNHYHGRIAIELRGTTSQTFPKKPYRIETQKPDGENNNIPLLGLPKENDWILYNPYSDKTMMRNALAYNLSRDLQEYASRSAFVEVFVNTDYKGVYVLLEKIKRDANRIDIAKMTAADSLGDALTGGYILKIDNVSGEQVEVWRSSHRTKFQYHYPKPSLITRQQENYIQNFINQFETQISLKYAHEIPGNYRKFINLDSFVHYFMVSELTKNIDSYRLSVYMYKDRDSRGGKLTLAPVWDFNLAFGNANYYDGASPKNWVLAMLNPPELRTRAKQPFWWQTLLSDADFISILIDRWHEMRHGLWRTERLLQRIDSLATQLDEAQVRNFQRWPIVGKYVWPNAYVGKSWQEDVYYLKTWLIARLDWLDEHIPELSKIPQLREVQVRALPAATTVLQNYPNPFHRRTNLDYFLASSTNVKIVVFNMRGQQIRQVKNRFELNGWQKCEWDGTDATGRRVATGIYLLKLQSGAEKHVLKLILL